jgi:anti-anti-sigma factor
VVRAENLLVRDGFGCPPLNSRSTHSEPPHAGDRLPAGITMTKLLALTTRHTARFDTRWAMSSVAIVSAYGDIDASNASTLTDYALANAVRCRGLILDLSGLKFFGTDGFSALHRVSVRCAHAEIGWMAVPAAAVSRVLRMCDPHGSLPIVDSVGVALANLQDQRADV